MQCMSDNPLDSQYHKQHWQGRTDKDGNLVWGVDFDKVVEFLKISLRSQDKAERQAKLLLKQRDIANA